MEALKRFVDNLLESVLQMDVRDVIITMLLWTISAWIVYKIIYLCTNRKYQVNYEHTMFNPLITDPDSYEDIPEPYPNSWYPILRSDELKPGQPVPLMAFDKDLVAYRTQSGKVHILDAFCPHMGAHLGIGGTVVGEEIRCPFHMWTFNGEGVCTSVPGLDQPPKAKINPWLVIEQDSYVYLWYHEDGLEPDWKPFKVNNFEKLHFSSEVASSVHGHFLDTFGNVFDVPHLYKRGVHDITRRIMHLHYVPRIEIAKGKNKEGTSVKITITGTFFGYPLKFFNVHLTLIPYPPVFYIDISIPGLGIKAFMTVVYVPVNPLRWKIRYHLYRIGWNPLTFIFIKLFPLGVISSVNAPPETELWINKKYLKRQHFTTNDHNYAEFIRWFKDNFGSKQTSDKEE